MQKFTEIIKEKIVIFDGAMGTSIQIRSPQFKGCPENLNLIEPKLIQDIHHDFLNAGAEVIETNTFGALPYLLSEFELQDKAVEINKQAVRLALEVTKSYDTPKFVSGSMGPGTKLPSLQQISYDRLYSDYLLQAETLISGGVHLIQIETGQDPLQMKIALRAVLDVKQKLQSDIPIFLQATLQANGQMLVGSDLHTFINIFKDMPIHGLGINCGTGPHHIESYVKTLSENNPKYISILPNAGLPVLKDGVLTYDLSPVEFGQICAELTNKYRINAIGGCCGTTVEYIRELTNNIKNTHPKTIKVENIGYLTSLYASQEIKTTPAPLIIGERANVNGSKIFKNLLNEDKWNEMVEVCLTQQDEGAHILDICLTHLNRDETGDMENFIPLLNKTVSTPLMIDSTNHHTIETALKFTAGKAIVNSVNFEHGEENVVRYIKTCRDMNAALVCLTIDEQGMAKLKGDKIKIINRFLALCDKYNFSHYQVFIDCLTFPLATGEEEYRIASSEAIMTMKYIKENHPSVNTIMGISNISYGMKPSARKILNSVFLNECVINGLSAAIIDPAKILPLNDIDDDKIKICQDLIYNRNIESDPLSKLIEMEEIHTETESVIEILTPEKQLYHSVIKGRSNTISSNITELLKITPPIDIINNILISAMQEVGNLFEKGKIQLPFVLKSAEIMKSSVDLLKPHMSDKNSLKKETMLLATVQGDVHDIGKNLVQIILVNNGYEVYDIGVKQSPQNIYEAIKKHNPTCLGMSALLIKSTEYMKETLIFLKSKGVSIPVICGGAALNKDFVEKELQKVYDGKIVFGKDAFAGLKFMQLLS